MANSNPKIKQLIIGFNLLNPPGPTYGLSLLQSGSLISNSNATSGLTVTLPSITNLPADSTLPTFIFQAGRNTLLKIQTTSPNLIEISDYNQNITKEANYIETLQTDSSVYQVGPTIQLVASRAGRWSIIGMTGSWHTDSFGNFDSLGFHLMPWINLGKSSSQLIANSTPISWTDILWQSLNQKLYFQWATGTAPITAEVSGLADIEASIEVAMPADGVDNGAAMRLIKNSTELGRNTKPEYLFNDGSLFHILSFTLKNVPISITDVFKMQAAYNSNLAGNMTVYNTVNTKIDIRYHR